MSKERELSFLRVLIALIIGFAGACFIWIAIPYNNFVLNNSDVVGSYMPEAALAILSLLILIINPLCRLINRNIALNFRQMALIFAVLLFATVIPGQGLLGVFPYALAKVNRQANLQRPLAEVHEKMDLPTSLFMDKIEFDAETPVSSQFLDELEEGATIPWSSWLPPLLSWGALILASWLLMIGLGMIVYPQWRHNERLLFPLLAVQETLIEDPTTEGSIMPALFKQKLFWIGCIVVLVLHSFNGLKHHTGNMFPGFPLGWNLSENFTEAPWRDMPGYIPVVQIYFTLVGITFFMPTRISFSIWVTMVTCGFYEMIRYAYFPPYYRRTLVDLRTGAMIVVTLAILWLGRLHWAKVFKSLFRVRTEEDHRNRMAGWMFLAGCGGLYGWFILVGVHPVWALVFSLIGFMVSLLITRIVAETGYPCMRIHGMTPLYFAKLAPAGWLTATTIYIAGFVEMIFQVASRVSVAVMTAHAIGLDRKATPRHQMRLAGLAIVILLMGLMICGAVHLCAGYHYAISLDGKNTPLSTWSSQMDETINALLSWSRDSWHPAQYNQIGHLLFGAGLAGALQWACMMSPKWPLHPIGLFLPWTHYGEVTWASILIGWLLKVLIVRYGGARVYHAARPLFIGIIMGEVFAVVVWVLVPVILILMGHDPQDVGHITLLP